ncbi:cellulose-binding protein [Saccharopolyspora dendranthemae]|uniref:DivIVA protein n=1 Tax=Saccharopolyspora dendranthemae TaxID=1181886 RepID=A0A561U351_9PSEU|nr:cellulose-binding protein [Saccharopolyspora dendranthemae]TWF93786.1 hypothetical protein FHU35_1458 [Saccharopolyspora dendranthemae]
MGHIEDRELVPLKADFDTVWYGYRRSQVKFYIQQTEAELRLVTEDRDSALSQVNELSTQLDQARAQVEELKAELDAQAQEPISTEALSDRMRRMVRLAQDEAKEIVASAQAASEHEWARSEQAAAELRNRYEKLVAEADEWRRQSEEQRNEMIARTRSEVQDMAKQAEQQRRQLDNEAEDRRVQVEHDFEVSMSARREEAMRILAEREQASRDEAQRRVREATAEGERRVLRADEYSATMHQTRQQLAEQVRAAQQILGNAEPFLVATETGSDTEGSDAYVANTVHNGESDVEVPKQRDEEPLPQEAEATV